MICRNKLMVHYIVCQTLLSFQSAQDGDLEKKVVHVKLANSWNINNTHCTRQFSSKFLFFNDFLEGSLMHQYGWYLNSNVCDIRLDKVLVLYKFLISNNKIIWQNNQKMAVKVMNKYCAIDTYNGKLRVESVFNRKPNLSIVLLLT